MHLTQAVHRMVGVDLVSGGPELVVPWHVPRRSTGKP